MGLNNAVMDVYKLMEYAQKKDKEKVRWFCVHDVSDDVGGGMSSIYSAFRGAVNNGGILEMFNKSACRRCSRMHTFYSLNKKPERQTFPESKEEALADAGRVDVNRVGSEAEHLTGVKRTVKPVRLKGEFMGINIGINDNLRLEGRISMEQFIKIFRMLVSSSSVDVPGGDGSGHVMQRHMRTNKRNKRNHTYLDMHSFIKNKKEDGNVDKMSFLDVLNGMGISVPAGSHYGNIRRACRVLGLRVGKDRADGMSKFFVHFK